MKIWFDISNSPHVNMFNDLILDLENNGHSAIITTRPLANTIDLLTQRGLNYTVVGEHYGKNLYKKIFGYPIRVMQLRRFLKKNKPDLAVSQSSFHSPLTAKLLGIPSIYTNDNEHALGNLPAFYFASRIFIPETISIESITAKGISKRKVIQYPGVKEGIYLWKKAESLNIRRMTRRNKNFKIYIRPEPLTAQYYKGKQNFLDETICELQEKYDIVILVRDKTQLLHYKQAKFTKSFVPEKPLEFDFIVKNCDLFIGAGGSMTRELAVLGVPTISVYQDDLLEVDKYLISKKVMSHYKIITTATVENYLDSQNMDLLDNEIMKKGEMAYKMLKNEILKYTN